MQLFKGASPNSHWWKNDARLAGFIGSAGVRNCAAVVRHITAFSHPSPYLSFSTSFDVACSYALPGSSATTPGYVYEVDLSRDSVVTHNPVAIVSSTPGGHLLPHGHNGAQDLIHGLADHRSYGSILSRPVKVHGGAVPVMPINTQELRALIFAIRDGEVLLEMVPNTCIVARHDVF